MVQKTIPFPAPAPSPSLPDGITQTEVALEAWAQRFALANRRPATTEDRIRVVEALLNLHAARCRPLLDLLPAFASDFRLAPATIHTSTEVEAFERAVRKSGVSNDDQLALLIMYVERLTQEPDCTWATFEATELGSVDDDRPPAFVGEIADDDDEGGSDGSDAQLVAIAPAGAIAKPDARVVVPMTPEPVEPPAPAPKKRRASSKRKGATADAAPESAAVAPAGPGAPPPTPVKPVTKPKKTKLKVGERVGWLVLYTPPSTKKSVSGVVQWHSATHLNFKDERGDDWTNIDMRLCVLTPPDVDANLADEVAPGEVVVVLKIPHQHATAIDQLLRASKPVPGTPNGCPIDPYQYSATIDGTDYVFRADLVNDENGPWVDVYVQDPQNPSDPAAFCAPERNEIQGVYKLAVGRTHYAILVDVV